MDFGSFENTIDKNIETDKASDKFDQQLPQFGITECLIHYKCSVNTLLPMPLGVGNNRRLKEVVLPLE